MKLMQQTMINLSLYALDMAAAIAGFYFGFGLQVQNWAALLFFMVVSRWLVSVFKGCYGLHLEGKKTARKIYIAGPMTGRPGLNFPAFFAEAKRLRALGWHVINPAEINPDHTMPWRECMRRDIAQLVTCDAIQMLPGWQQSKGATLEHHIAERLELEIFMDVKS